MGGKSSSEKSSYQKGSEKGYGEGLADKPSSHPGHLLDFLNLVDENQQKYEDGLEKGYAAGQQAHAHQKQ